MDHGAYSWGGDVKMTKPIRFAYFPYSIPHVAGLIRVANTNHNFGVAYRSYRSPQAYTLGEAMMDMLAEKAGIDSFEFQWIIRSLRSLSIQRSCGGTECHKQCLRGWYL
ncbi:MAG: molybdopterin-dependent oxidoreductase [Anaerolineales bacterium]|nr:molybdopterin-dependent oxidoreductase [Anaerolineales bacterium]